jgi:beta-glucosidase-like glycosyl hydrolase
MPAMLAAPVTFSVGCPIQSSARVLKIFFWFPGVARLGVDPICFNDSPTGVAGSYKSSQFPAEITYGATWNRQLTYEGGVAMGKEFKATGVTNGLAVVAGGLGTT